MSAFKNIFPVYPQRLSVTPKPNAAFNLLLIAQGFNDAVARAIVSRAWTAISNVVFGAVPRQPHLVGYCSLASDLGVVLDPAGRQPRRRTRCLAAWIGCALSILPAKVSGREPDTDAVKLATEAARHATSTDALDWLLGEWIIKGADRAYCMTWSRSQERLLGRLERVEPDGKRELSTLLAISPEGDGLQLVVERVLESSVAGLLSNEVRERVPGRDPVHHWPVYPHSSQRPPRSDRKALTFKGVLPSPQEATFRPSGAPSKYLRERFPIKIELQLVRGNLLVREDHGRGGFKPFEVFSFTQSSLVHRE